MNQRFASLLLRLAAVLLLPLSAPTSAPARRQAPVKVACVGNSITYGATLAHRERDAYPAQLQRLLGPGYVVGNFGKSGATLLERGHRPYLLQDECRRALDFAADIVVIHLGINDTDPRDWPLHRDDFVRDYLHLIDTLRSVNPRARFLVARLSPIGCEHPRFDSGTRLWHSEIQQAISTVAALSKAELIDFHEPLYAYPRLLPDQLHPTAAGAARLAREVYGSITGRWGGLQVPLTYTDHMVLQRRQPLRLSGRADAHERVNVRLGSHRASTRADLRGRWAVVLPSMEAAQGLQLRIETPHRRLTFEDVAIGEVWLCSGQSNMAFRLEQSADAPTDLAHSGHDDGLRLFDMKGRWETSATPWPLTAIDSVNRLLYFTDARWTPCTPAAARRFSAIAYHFGRMLRDSLGVPVGLICNAVGGSGTEAWIDRGSMEEALPSVLRHWLRNDFIQDWVRGRARLNLQRAQIDTCRHPYEPCYLFEAGIAPLTAHPIKGVVWYQGESNAQNFEVHERLFPLLVQSWRRAWHEAELPFYFVQLSSLNRPSWPWFRDSQRRLMEQVAHTGMVVTTDCGDSLDVHPRRKRPVGERLGRWALSHTYGRRLTPSGPLLQAARADGADALVSFRYAHGLRPASGTTIIGFEAAETDGLFYPATATPEGEELRISCPGLKRIRWVRYGWQPFTRANLVNADGLPASTFRTAVP